MSIRDKLVTTRKLLDTVFLHDPIYADSVVASFASRSHLCLLGFRGSGKTHLMECITRMVDRGCVSVQQGYLSAELEDVFARPDIPSLMRGEEKVVWKDMVMARVKAFDEIQRLGVGALSAMFRLLTSGTVMYLDQEMGIKEFWAIATANPTELSEDTLNVRLPEPLWDRFDGVLWVPIAPLKYQIRINGGIEQAKDSLPVIWDEESLLALWREVSKVEIPQGVEYTITLINRIMGFCMHAQNYDASSLSESQKRSICSKCNRNYICSSIARPPSVRAKLSLAKLARGFAYLRGSDRVDLIDVHRAFPLVYWKRVVLMDEESISNRLLRLQNLIRDLTNEIMESKEAVDIANGLKVRFENDKYRQLKQWSNSKPWIVEVVEDLEDYFARLKAQLMEKFEGADMVGKIKVSILARSLLPPDLAKAFEPDRPVEVELTNDNLVKLACISKDTFNKAKLAKDSGLKVFTLTGEQALMWITKYSK